jgi:hypothetical protein
MRLPYSLRHSCACGLCHKSNPSGASPLHRLSQERFFTVSHGGGISLKVLSVPQTTCLSELKLHCSKLLQPAVVLQLCGLIACLQSKSPGSP